MGAFCPTRASVRHSILKPVAVPYDLDGPEVQAALAGLAEQYRAEQTARREAEERLARAEATRDAWTAVLRGQATLRVTHGSANASNASLYDLDDKHAQRFFQPAAPRPHVQNWARIECLKTPKPQNPKTPRTRNY